MGYYIYGKRTAPWKDAKGHTREPDKTFKALDRYGVRVSTLAQAKIYEHKDDAQKVIEWNTRDGVVFEIRRSK